MPPQSPPRSLTLLQIVLAMVFLTVIGGSGGYLAAHRQKQHQAAGRAQTGSPAAPTLQPTGRAPASPSPGPSTRTECLPHTEQLAGITPLYELLYIRTAQSEVWICQDGAGTLYYQGHRGQPGEDLVEGTNALFLTKVDKDPAVDGGYVATNVDHNGTTRYFVSPKRLVQEINGVRRKPEPAISGRVG
jgi:hypothetical protein